MENRERGIGWPLGLGSMYMRLRMVDTLQVGGTDHTTPSPCFRSSSFSSFSSSNLDTESSASFFQDKSKSLGRLIGVTPRNSRRSELYATTNTTVLHCSEAPHTTSSGHSHELLDLKMCDGICIPLCLVAKMSKNKDGSRKR